MAYEGYITKLLHNLDNRFEDETFDICVDNGKLFNFHSLLYPCTGELMVEMDPLNIETSEDLFAVLNNLPFIDKVYTHYMYPQYKMFLKFVHAKCSLLKQDPGCCFANYRDLTVSFLKGFVNERGTECSDLARLMSFSVSFPVSEAIVESWGSTITHLYSLKHNDVAETGTFDNLSR